MARRLLVFTTAALLSLTAACGTDDDDPVASGDQETSTTAAGDEATEPATTETEDEDVAETTTEGEETEADVTETEGDATEEETKDDGASQGDGSNPEFCQIAEELNTLFDDLEADDYDGFATTVEDAESTFEDYLEALPEDLRDDGEVLVDAVRQLGAELGGLSGDPDAQAKAEAAFEKISTPVVEAASNATDAYEEKTCGAE